MRFFKLLKILILRNIKEEKFLTLLSIIGIALGIGLFTGVKVASDRAIASFESDIRGINPYANYEILDTSGIDFDERVYKDVRILEEDILPVIKTFGYISSFKDMIDINGVYTVRAAEFLKEEKGEFLSEQVDLDRFFRTINGILITKKFADMHSLTKGDVLKAQVYDREYELKIVGVLNAVSLPTSAAIMDIGNFQEYFGKAGLLSRIDLASGG